MFVSTIDMMLRRRFSALRVTALFLGAACCTMTNAQTGLFDATEVEYTAGVSGIYSSGDFAPYYMASNRGGRVTRSKGILTEAAVRVSTDSTRRFILAAWLDLAASRTSAVDYDRYSAASSSWSRHALRSPAFWLQQGYVSGRYRSIAFMAGIRDYESPMLNNRLSSGDLTRSPNPRPLPEAGIGLAGFRKMPFTSGWREVDGWLSYGKYTDNGWWHDHFNHYNYHLAQNQWLVYRRLYLRSDASKRFCITAGIQAATQFGGYTEYYENGIKTRTDRRSTRLKEFLKVIIPTSGGSEDFYTGNTLGSIDIMARYRIGSIADLRLYLQNPWEDGSGLGKLNGFDGLWGLEYRPLNGGIISGAVIEYLDMTNQSGPLHYAPDYIPGSDITAEATGADDYYNNYYYNSYANFGMIAGSPMVMSPVYNTDGFPGVVTNRMRAIHLGLESAPLSCLSVRVLASWRKAWGNGYVPLIKPRHSFSAMLETMFAPGAIKGLSVNLRLGMDRGTLPSNAAGAELGITYSGNFTLNRH